jgi:hypothetical protein
MSDPKQPERAPETIKTPGGTPGAYPMQLVILVVVFALAVGVYFFLTRGEADGGHLSGPRIERGAERAT